MLKAKIKELLKIQQWRVEREREREKIELDEVRVNYVSYEIQPITRRERLKLAPYLRLKKRRFRNMRRKVS